METDPNQINNLKILCTEINPENFMTDSGFGFSVGDYFPNNYVCSAPCYHRPEGVGI